MSASPTSSPASPPAPPPAAAAALRALLRVDAGGGLLAGAAMLLLHPVLAPHYGLPEGVLLGMAGLNLAYGLGSGSLLRATPPLRPRATAALAAANMAWLLPCLGIALAHRAALRPLGLAHLLLEGAYVAALGALELRALRRCRAPG